MCKGRVERWVYLSKKCSDMIHEYAKESEGRLFKIGKEQVRNIVEKAMKELGIKGTPHTLRHSFASIMYQQTKDIRLVQELLGHKSIESTQIYAHINSESVRKAVESNPLGVYYED
jgi:site-specific recombinase XerD